MIEAIIEGKKIKIDDNNSIGNYFREKAKKYGERTAIVYKDNSYSFSDIDKMSDFIALKMKSLNIKHRSIVAIEKIEGIDFLLIVLALLKQGAIAFMIENNMSEYSFDYVVNHIELDYIISNRADKKKGITCIDANTLLKIKDFEDSFYYDIDVRGIDTAFIFMTSGSTGKPKIVEVSHINVLNDVMEETCQPKIIDTDVFLLSSSVASLRILGEIFYPWFSGAAVIVLEDGYKKDVNKMIEVIKNYNITVITTVPTVLNELLNYKNFSLCKSLRMIQVMGEKLNSNTITRCLNNMNVELYNVYGQTEVGMCSVKQIKSINDANNCGKPYSNRIIYIISDEMELLDKGEIGNIYIGGSYFSKEYYVNNDKTNFMEWKNKKIYKTGDVGYINDKGELIFNGRNDNIYKICGKKVSKNLIENALLRINDVNEVYVDIWNVDNLTYICAVLSTFNEECNIDIIKEKVKDILPVYLQPTDYILVDKFPQLCSGKRDIIKIKEIIELNYNSKNMNIYNNTLIDEIIDVTKIDIKKLNINKTLIENGINSMKIVALFVSIENKYNILIEDVFQRKIIDLINYCEGNRND